MKPGKSLLLQPVFIVSLFVLAANDHWWKEEYANVLTGKLSDLAGLVVLPLLLRACFPHFRQGSLVVSGLFFIWWKLPLSQPVLDLLNQELNLHLGRVEDPTDLVALAVLPLVARLEPFRYRLAAGLALAGSWILGFCSLALLCATSMPARYAQRQDSPVYVGTTVKAKGSGSGIEDRFQRAGIALQRDTGGYDRVYSQQLFIRNPDSTGPMMIPLTGSNTNTYVFRPSSEGDYLIPSLLISGDTLRNIRVNIKDNKVFIRSFKPETPMPPEYFEYKQTRKNYEKPLRRKIKAILEEK